MRKWHFAAGTLVLLCLVAVVGGLKGGPTFHSPATGRASDVSAGTTSSRSDNSPGSSDRSTPAISPLWSSTPSLSAEQNALQHWQKHGAEFPEFRDATQYIEGARWFFQTPPAGTLFKSRPNGDRLFYHPASNTFGVQASNGAPRTMFRPDSGMRYWNRQ